MAVLRISVNPIETLILLLRAIAFSDVQVRGVALFRGTPTSNRSSEDDFSAMNRSVEKTQYQFQLHLNCGILQPRATIDTGTRFNLMSNNCVVQRFSEL